MNPSTRGMSCNDGINPNLPLGVIWGHNTYFSGVVPIMPDYRRSL